MIKRNIKIKDITQKASGLFGTVERVLSNRCLVF